MMHARHHRAQMCELRLLYLHIVSRANLITELESIGHVRM